MKNKSILRYRELPRQLRLESPRSEKPENYRGEQTPYRVLRGRGLPAWRWTSEWHRLGIPNVKTQSLAF